MLSETTRDHNSIALCKECSTFWLQILCEY